jgi:hypothetical protein
VWEPTRQKNMAFRPRTPIFFGVRVGVGVHAWRAFINAQ